MASQKITGSIGEDDTSIQIMIQKSLCEAVEPEEQAEVDRIG